MDVDGLLLDIDGVLVIDRTPVPGAADAIAALRSRRLPFCCLTNTTSHSRHELAEVLRDGGIDVPPDLIVTATSATAAYLREAHAGASAFVLNDGSVVEDMPHVALVDTPEDADVMVIGGAGEGFTYDVINRMFRRVMAGAPLVAMHRSRYWRSGDGYELDGAAYVAALVSAAGVEAVVCGKPAPAFFASALDVIGVPAARAAMVGDDIVTDVEAARAAGLRGVLVRTGKFRSEDLDRGHPDAVLASIADLPAWLGP